MALLLEINRQKINLYEQEIKQLNKKYDHLLEQHVDAINEIKQLKKELEFFHRETRRHKQEWSSMFYTPNEMGYMFELENIEKKERSKSL